MDMAIWARTALTLVVLIGWKIWQTSTNLAAPLVYAQTAAGQLANSDAGYLASRATSIFYTGQGMSFFVVILALVVIWGSMFFIKHES